MVKLADLPVRAITMPEVLTGHANGRLPDSILVDVPCLYSGPTVRLVAPAARAWTAMRAAGARPGIG